MEYFINSSALASVFTVPCAVVDRHIKLAGAVQLKVLLYLMRHMSEGISTGKISAALGLPEADVTDALHYWVEADIIKSDSPSAPNPAEAEKRAPKAVKPLSRVLPSREEVAKRGLESEEIAFLLREAQMKFGRGLRQNEASTLVWLCDDEGMNVALLLMLIEFAISEKKCNIGFIERTAMDWIGSGIETIAEAEARICEIYAQRTAWRKVEGAMGIDHRMPSTKELTAAHKWVEEWGFSKEMLHKAYEECVDNTAKFSVPYINRILENWHKQNIKSPADLQNAKKPEGKKKSKSSDYAGYDLDLVEKMLQMDDDKN